MNMLNTQSDNFANLLLLLDENAMEAIDRCRKAFKGAVKAHHQTVYDTIAFVAAFVLHLKEIEEDRQTFLDNEHWTGKPHPPKEKNLTRLAAMYVVGARESRGALYQQALQYAKVIDHFLAEGVEPERIPKELNRVPIYRLLDELNGDGAEVEPASVVPKESPAKRAEQPREDDEGVDHDDLDTDDPGDDARSSRAAGTGLVRPSGKRRAPMFNADEHIALTGRRFQRPILDMELHETRWVRIERVEDEDGVLRYDVLAMEHDKDA